MSAFFSFVRYLRVKLLVSLFRLITRLVQPLPKSTPDAILAIPSRDTTRTIKTHVYLPPQPKTPVNTPQPVLLNFFGGGFVMPFHGADDLFCRRMAAEAGHIVLDVSYRLAPEHPFPAALHDAEDAVRYVVNHPEKYNTSQISVSGFSSGGTCVLALLTSFPRDTFQSAITFYPSTNAAQDPSLRVAPVPGGKKAPALWTRVFREAYFGEADPRDPRISPIDADTSVYPGKMLVITAEMDTSALEAEALAEKAAAEGGADEGRSREVVVRRVKRVGHGFDKKSSNECVLAREESYALALQMLKSVTNE